MPRKKHKAEEIVAKLRQVDVLTAQGRPVADAVRSIGLTEVTCYRWQLECGGLEGNPLKRLKEVEAENNRLRRAFSDLTIEKLTLKEVASEPQVRDSETSNPRKLLRVHKASGCPASRL